MRAFWKAIVVAMMLALACMLAACGGSGSSESADSSASGESAEASAESGEGSASGEEASAMGATYTNEFFGLAFDVPADWSAGQEASLSGLGDMIVASSEDARVDLVAMSNTDHTMVIVALEGPNEANSGHDAATHLQSTVDTMAASLEGAEYVSRYATLDFYGGQRSIPTNITSVTVDDATLFLGMACEEAEGNFMNITVIGGSEESVFNAFRNFRSLT